MLLRSAVRDIDKSLGYPDCLIGVGTTCFQKARLRCCVMPGLSHQRSSLLFQWSHSVPRFLAGKGLFYLFIFPDRIFFCSPGCPGTCSVDHVGLENKRSACLHLLGSGIRDLCHHSLAVFCGFSCYTQQTEAITHTLSPH